jgi:hypothetical protein
VITEDEATRLLKRADPARFDESAPFVDAAGYLAALRTRSTTVTLIDTEPTPTRPPSRHRWPIIAVAAAAVVAIVVVGLVLATRDDDPNDQIPAATTVAPDPATAAEEVAQGFVEAYGALDVDGALTYLADDAYIPGLIDPFTTEDVQGTRDELRLSISMLEAHRYQQMGESCDEQSGSTTVTDVRCTFEFHSLGSDELGFGPFSGNYFDLTVRDAGGDSSGNRWPPQIVRASYHFDDERFSSQVWSPFADWMEANHLDDAAVMYSPTTAGGEMGVRLTDESIQLWGQHIREYVQGVLTSRRAYRAEVAGICATQAARLGELAVPAEGVLDQVAAWNTAAAAILEQAHQELIALDKPPATDTRAYSLFYGRLFSLVRIAEESAQAATAGDSTRLAELDTEYREVRQAMSSGPASSGLEECLASLPS